MLRVPVDTLDPTVNRITNGTLGKLLSRSSSAQDVTGDVVDLTSRVGTQKASVARIRELLAKAGDLKDVVLLEGELTRREADLESLESRLGALNDRADLSSLTVSLRTPAAAVVRPAPGSRLPHVLQQAWDALRASTGVLLTVIGALLPFALLGLVLWLPGGWAWRRWQRRRASGVTRRPGPQAAAGPDPQPATSGPARPPV